MNIPDVQLFIQALVYLTIFFTGFVVSIPLGLTHMNFDGNCILYGEVSWKNFTYFILTPSENTNCNFPVYFNVFACIFFALGMFIYFAYAILQKDPNIGSQMWVMPFVLLSAVVTVVSFISSCIISVGFKTLCDHLTLSGHVIKSCADAGDVKFDKVDWNPKHFFAYLTTAQSASWIGFLCWSVQVVLGIVRFLRNRRLRSQAYQDSLNTSDTKKIADVEPTA